MKYEVKVCKEVRFIDTFYVEADSVDEAREIVGENPDTFDDSKYYDCSYWEILSVNEI